MVQCPHCNEWQELDWYVHFVDQDDGGRWRLRDAGDDPVADARPLCAKCGRPFDRLGPGQWVITAPDKSEAAHGYHVSRLFGAPGNDGVNARPIIREEFERFQSAQGSQFELQIFHNNRLGIPYVNKDEKITDAILDNCRGDYDLPYNRTTGYTVAGVDQGKNFHVRISELQNGERIPRYIGILQSWPQVNSILDEFHVTTVVVDAQGGGYAETRAFVEQREGAYMCYYVSKDSVTNQYVLDNKHQVVKVNRTELCDVFIACLKNGTCLMPRNYASHLKGELKSQLMTPVRTIDAGGRPVWTKGVDHFFHAHVYETVAVLISGMSNSVREKRSWRI